MGIAVAVVNPADEQPAIRYGMAHIFTSWIVASACGLCPNIPESKAFCAGCLVLHEALHVVQSGQPEYKSDSVSQPYKSHHIAVVDKTSVTTAAPIAKPQAA